MEELEARVAALEEQLPRLKQDAAAARILAGGADQDVAALATRLDAQTRLLTALRETQVEQGRDIAGLKTEVAGVKREMREGFGKLATGQAEITALLNRLTGPEQGE